MDPLYAGYMVQEKEMMDSRSTPNFSAFLAADLLPLQMIQCTLKEFLEQKSAKITIQNTKKLAYTQ